MPSTTIKTFAIEQTPYESAKEMSNTYVLTRSFKDSVRLSAQHWMWWMATGFQVHPKATNILNTAPTNNLPLQVLDIGCGNAAWLLDFQRETPILGNLPIEFHGLDISANYFPISSHLPNNVHMHVADILSSDPPTHLLNRFDMIHIRMFLVVIRNNDPLPLLRNVMKMLKPGGVFQWDELDLTSWRVEAPSADISCEKSQAWADATHMCHRGAQNIIMDWIPTLAKHFASANFTVLDSARFPIPRPQRRLFTDNMIMAMDNIGGHATRVSESKGYLPGTEFEWESGTRGMLEEVERGVVFSVEYVCVLGKREG